MTRHAFLLVFVLVASGRPALAQTSDSAPAAPNAPLTLQAFVERAIATSTAVQLAVTRRDEADAAIGSARAARRPTITANAQFNWQPSANAGASGLTWSPDPTAPLEQRVRYLELAAPSAALGVLNPQILASAAQYAWIGGISSQSTVLDGGRTRAAVAAAKARRDASDAIIDAERARARLDAELAYRQLQLAREQVATAVRARETTSGERDAACSRWSRGLVSELDVLRTEMALADLDRRLADARATESRAAQRLRLLGDLPAGSELQLATPVDASSLGDLTAIEPTELLVAVQQAEHRSAEAAVAAAQAEVRATRANRLPSLVVRADLQAIRAPTDPLSLGGVWQDVQTVTVGFQVPILRPGQRSAERSAEARLAQSRVDVKRVADGTRLDSESVSAERARARSGWLAARARLAAADRATELTAGALSRGIATPTDEARSRLDVLEARTQLLQALVDYLSADAVAGNAARGNTTTP
ncbi:TolC family protein [Gemmatimonas phototrophica]|uniref:Transporter n=1 Tax=Gemmatimonas phototrophica TaxID=1379270 RepID=A0A143BKA8_9BACT|nr:TolC family protein [Gemmatimonas phototrophica]AMW05496.1 hypothetical protein GEMMAAP_13150 [Gemmatimonas phototrophica]